MKTHSKFYSLGFQKADSKTIFHGLIYFYFYSIKIWRLDSRLDVSWMHPGRGNTVLSPLKCTEKLGESPSLPFKVYRVSFPGVKRPGRGVDHLAPSSAEVKNDRR
jgi:hypothetical protein